jgi:FAD/FMN-containing dehydrogenase
VEPVKRFGRPAMDVIGPMPYSAVNMMFDPGFPPGALNYWKSNFLSALTDDAIETIIARFSACPSPMEAVLLEHFHGAATRLGPTDTAFPHRTPGFNLLVVGEWMDPAESAANVAWARETYGAMGPYFAPGRYGNYLNAEETGERESVAASFGPNWPRLREVKRRYDPENVFHLNLNIRP